MDYGYEKVREVEAYAILHLTQKRMAAMWGVDQDTITNWKNQYPEFREAMERGYARPVYDLTAIAYKDALGQPEKRDANGNVTQPYIPPNADRAMQLLKSFARDVFGEKSAVELTGANGGAMKIIHGQIGGELNAKTHAELATMMREATDELQSPQPNANTNTADDQRIGN